MILGGGLWLLLTGALSCLFVTNATPDPSTAIRFSKDAWQYPLVCLRCPVSPREGDDGCTPARVYPTHSVDCTRVAAFGNFTCEIPREIVWFKVFAEPSTSDRGGPRRPRRALFFDVSDEYVARLERPLDGDEATKCARVRDEEDYWWIRIYLVVLSAGVCFIVTIVLPI